MFKKFPYLLLILAALLFFWIKKTQVGNAGKDPVSPANYAEEFIRDTTNINYTRHARCRMDCRHIDESEVKEMVVGGEINREKIEVGPKGTTYPLEGMTHDGQHVRIVVAPHPGELVIVTVIDLEKEWQCNCN